MKFLQTTLKIFLANLWNSPLLNNKISNYSIDYDNFRVFPEKREGPALLSFESLFPTRQPHGNNSCATLDYFHLSFGEVQHRPVIQGKCFKSCTQAGR